MNTNTNTRGKYILVNEVAETSAGFNTIKAAKAFALQNWANTGLRECSYYVVRASNDRIISRTYAQMRWMDS